MPIYVHGPDGYQVGFPDGTDGPTITAFMQRRYGPPRTQQAAPQADAAQAATLQAAPQGGAAPISADDMMRAAIRGVPIAGGAMDKLAAGMDALTQPMLGRGSAAGSLGQRYAENIAQQQARDQAFDIAHPIASALTQLAGGVGLTMGVGSGPAGARALGILPQTAGLVRQGLAGAASGAGINAADALVRGNDPGTAALMGGGLGAAAPVVSRAIGGLAAPVASAVRGFVNPAEEAQRQVGSAIASGQRLGGTGPTAAMTDPQFAAAQAGGQPVMNLERGGEPARNAVRWAANTSPEARQTLNEALDNRYYTQGNRLVDYLRTLFNFPNAYAQQKALADVGKLSNKALYDAAMAQGTGPIVSPELERLVGSDDVTSALQRAVKIQGSENVAQGYGAMSPRIQITPDGRIMFGGKPIGQPTAGMPMSGTGGMLAYPDLQLWDLTRQQLSGSATQAFRSGDNAAGRRLSSLAQQLNDALDTHPQATGYAAARGNAAQIFGAQDALEAGQQAVHTKMGNDELRDAVARLNPLERQLFQDGYASELINRIREMPDRTDIVNQIANTPAVRERNAIALGQDRANQIEAWLRVENIMNQGRRAVQGNSSTAAQLMSSALWGAGGSFLETGNPFDPGVFLRDAFLRHGFRQSVNMARNAANQRIANQMVTLLTSQDPNAIRMGMAMAARPVWLDALRRTDTGLARSGAVQMQ